MITICSKCKKRIDIGKNITTCPYCGKTIRDLPKELEVYAEKTILIIKNMLEIMDSEMIPTAFFVTETNIEPCLFEIRNDGVEEKIKELSESIKQRKDIVAIVLATEMWLIKDVQEALSIFVFNRNAAFMDIVPFKRSESGIEFGNGVRMDVTNNFSQFGCLAIVYKEFLENDNKLNSNSSDEVQKIIDDITNYVKRNRHRCPDLEGVSTNKVINELILAKAIDIYNSENQGYRINCACKIFLYLENNKLLSGNMERVLCFFLGQMYKYGFLVDKNIFQAMSYYLKCIGDSESKNGYLSFVLGNEFPIEMTMGNIDNFVKAAKIELGDML